MTLSSSSLPLEQVTSALPQSSLTIALALLLVLPTSAQLPADDLRGVDAALTVTPTEILTLGSTHLSQMGDALDPSMLDDLRARLVAYRPDVVTIENVPGTVCEELLRHPGYYADAGESYCRDVAEFRAESGLSMDSALTRVRTTLADWPAAPSAGQRRGLAAAFLAANDRYSALVQWLRLFEQERRPGEGLGEASVAYLTKLAGSINESVQLGARVAAEAGLERVYPVDDHSADQLYAGLGDDFGEAIQATWAAVPDSARAPVMAEIGRLTAGAAEEGGVLALYRAFNRPDIQRAFARFDFRQQMNDARPEAYGRRYVAWWQTRNLRMVANVVAAAAEAPGGRVLCIVGASHKLYYDAYLDLMHDVRLGDAQALLR